MPRNAAADATLAAAGIVMVPTRDRPRFGQGRFCTIWSSRVPVASPRYLYRLRAYRQHSHYPVQNKGDPQTTRPLRRRRRQTIKSTTIALTILATLSLAFTLSFARHSPEPHRQHRIPNDGPPSHAAVYYVNGDRIVQRNEVIGAIRDYFKGIIDRPVVIALIRLYFSSEPYAPPPGDETDEVNSMNILGIDNRDENWNTARHMVGLSPEQRVTLVEQLGQPPGLRPEQVKLELFWLGVRDYKATDDGAAWANSGRQQNDVVDAYKRLFPDLRQDVEAFNGFRDLKEWNYNVDGYEDTFLSNLENTEIDIVLETTDRLFIGEAKVESGLGSDSDHVLVHQLIRQYVTAHILLDLLVNRSVYGSREVVPFVVVEDAEYTRRTSQVRFMVDQEWLRPENVLSWRDIAELAP